MSDVAIKIEHLTKVYKIFNKPIDRVKEALNPFGKRYSEDFFALNDISITINKGETVGIIGKNGAGKSTILKAITGVLSPSSGTVKTYGKIASLLELGAGFNPEMTGRENIYLNGSIMGFSREEMENRIPAIIEFADIGEFIDQPVKMYSSGMFARLAFSVNIAVEPDILIVDEALSVGDFMFQFKCMQKFKELQKHGITILFVSHASQQIINVCNRCVFLKHGCVEKDSYDVQNVVFSYEEDVRNTGKNNKKIVDTNYENDANIKDNIELEENENGLEILALPDKSINEYRYGNHEAVIDHVYINYDDSDLDEEVVEAGRIVYIKLYIKSKRDMLKIVGGISIHGTDGSSIWGTNTLNSTNEVKLKKGWNILTYKTELNIVAGDYVIFVGIANIENSNRIELDQRRPARLLKIRSNSLDQFDGVVFSKMKVYMR